jgi:hypothetical protein
MRGSKYSLIAQILGLVGLGLFVAGLALYGRLPQKSEDVPLSTVFVT